MDFTTWLEGLKSLTQVLAGLGLVTIVLAYLKQAAERRCWRNYKWFVERWIDQLIRVHDVHPKELTETQWIAEVEQMLSDAKFGPLQIQQLLQTAVIVAKAMASERVSW